MNIFSRFFSSPASEDDCTVRILTPEEAQSWLKSGDAVLIDVREDNEFQAEHIHDALSAPLSSFNPTDVVKKAAGKKIILQCLSGKRSAAACQQFKAVTGEKPYRMQGCLTGWKQAGLPTESS